MGCREPEPRVGQTWKRVDKRYAHKPPMTIVSIGAEKATLTAPGERTANVLLRSLSGQKNGWTCVDDPTAADTCRDDDSADSIKTASGWLEMASEAPTLTARDMALLGIGNALLAIAEATSASSKPTVKASHVPAADLLTLMRETSA